MSQKVRLFTYVFSLMLFTNVYAQQNLSNQETLARKEIDQLVAAINADSFIDSQADTGSISDDSIYYYYESSHKNIDAYLKKFCQPNASETTLIVKNYDNSEYTRFEYGTDKKAFSTAYGACLAAFKLNTCRNGTKETPFILLYSNDLSVRKNFNSAIACQEKRFLYIYSYIYYANDAPSAWKSFWNTFARIAFFHI